MMKATAVLSLSIAVSLQNFATLCLALQVPYGRYRLHRKKATGGDVTLIAETRMYIKCWKGH